MKLGIRVVERISLDVHLRTIKITNIPDMTPRTSVNRYRRFGGTASHSSRPENLRSPNVSVRRISYRIVGRRNMVELSVATSQAGTGAESSGEYFPTFRKIVVTLSSGSSRPKAQEHGQQINLTFVLYTVIYAGWQWRQQAHCACRESIACRCTE
jgi:hypothetical protein